MNPDSIPRGGPAFPGKSYSGLASSGLSARDYFATAAMQALLPRGMDGVDTSRMAYEMADAMLIERNKS